MTQAAIAGSDREQGGGAKSIGSDRGTMARAMRGATGTAKREVAERRIEQKRQPARNPKAGNIIACSRANGKTIRTGVRLTSSNKRQEEDKIQLLAWGLADGKSRWIGGAKSDSTAGGNGCQQENDSRNSIDTGETRSCRTPCNRWKVSRNVTARFG